MNLAITPAYNSSYKKLAGYSFADPETHKTNI